MQSTELAASDEIPASRIASLRYLPFLLLLFFGSGCAALIYEVVWFQLLELVIGSSGISVGILLGTFMGGMCLGSLLLPRIIPARVHPLKVYGLLELGIALTAILVLHLLPIVAELYSGFIWHGVVVRAVLAAVCLIPPTILMGATLPAAARFAESTPKGVSWMGFFYGGNIAGAVIGCLGAGFFLLRLFDMPTATYVAAFINLVIALAGLMAARKAPYERSAQEHMPSSHIMSRTVDRKLIYVATALSGLSAMAAEVVWTRLLSLLLGATVYSFSIILAVFLLGLGMGSSAGSAISRTYRRPQLAFSLCQMLLALAIGWAAFMISRSLPYWPIDPGTYTNDWGPWYMFQLDLLRAAWMVFPSALLWGASFPLAIASVASRDQDPGRMVGAVYAANTIGAIIGSIAFSLVVIPGLGTQWAQRILIITVAISALVGAIAYLMRQGRSLFAAFSRLSYASVVGLSLTIVVLIFVVGTVTKVPWILVAWGRFCATYAAQAEPEIIDESRIPKGRYSQSQFFCTYVGEGLNIPVAVTRTAGGDRFFHGAGKVQASSLQQDMRLQRMLGHLSALGTRNPDQISDVLVIACGAGVTAGSFVPYPNIRQITICDIEPLVPKVVAPMFGKENYHIVDGIDKQNPRMVNGKEVRVVYDDGRHYIRTLPDDVKFDVITSDPVDPWIKGSAALNTVEYYRMCKRHLKPGGVMTLWMPLYESSVESAKSMIATFFEVFPDGMLFSNDQYFEGYDAVLLGRAEPSPINVDRLSSLLRQGEYRDVRNSLLDAGFGAGDARYDDSEQDVPIALLATFAARAQDLSVWLRDAQINHDRNLRLQYLAGMRFNSALGTRILQNILDCYRFPSDLFTGSGTNIDYLKTALSHSGRIDK